jgi:hypothetical protein
MVHFSKVDDDFASCWQQLFEWQERDEIRHGPLQKLTPATYRGKEGWLDSADLSAQGIGVRQRRSHHAYAWNEQVFVTCFNGEEDDLTQWDRYGKKNGYAIGFYARGFWREPTSWLYKVIYDKARQEKASKELAEATLTFFLWGLHDERLQDPEKWGEEFFLALGRMGLQASSPCQGPKMESGKWIPTSSWIEGGWVQSGTIPAKGNDAGSIPSFDDTGVDKAQNAAPAGGKNNNRTRQSSRFHKGERDAASGTNGILWYTCGSDPGGAAAAISPTLAGRTG